MLLYKYRSIDNLWLTLDIILNNRVWCAKWDTLNDPLEGRYHAAFDDRFNSLVDKRRDEWRICSFSASLDSFLLWSHYASGHKGIAIEVDIPVNAPELSKVNYQPFSPVFTHVSESLEGQRHLFETKTEQWGYEEEFRVLCKDEFYNLPGRVKKVYLGYKIDSEQREILRKVLPSEIDLIQMELDSFQGIVKPSIA